MYSDGEIFPNNPNYNDSNNSLINYQNTNPSSININYGNNDKDPSFNYKDCSLVDFRNKMKNKLKLH